jgi:Rhs element Vgr protein
MANSPILNSDGVVSVTILSEGTAIASTVEIISVEIDQCVNRISSATIIVNDGDMPNATFPLSEENVFKPGSAIDIQLGYDNTVTTVFSGVVIKHSIKISGVNASRLIIECRDKALAMSVGRKNANYIDKKDSDIITALIGNYAGLTATVTATTNQHKELVQFYCSDWDFMVARAEANGQWVIVKNNAVTVKAPDGSTEPVLTVTYGMDMMDFSAEMDARAQYQSAKTTGWDLATLQIVQQTASPQALTGQGNITGATLAQVLGLSEFELQTDAPLPSAELTDWAKAQLLKSELSRIRGHVTFQGNSTVSVGDVVELKGVGARFNGNVLVTACTHSVSEGNWTTRVDFGTPAAWFTEEHHDIAAPLAAGLTGGITGLHIGIVKKLDADPESQYKIQVSVPVMHAETDGVWARLGNFYGSNSFGAFFIPEIGDEVILGFFNDDPSHPVILGSLYSSKNKAPYELTADNFIKAIITRSKLKIEFDDDKKVITVTTPAKNKIVIRDDAKSILIQDQTNNKVELNTSGITLDSPKDIVISAKGKITLDAVGNVEITSKADFKGTGLNVTHTANIGFTAKGSATAELSASGTTTIKGAMVMIN